MHKLSRLLTIRFLLAMLCFVLQPSLAHAQTTTASTTAQAQSRPVVAYLKRDMGNYYFTPNDVSIETDTVLVIVNQTGRDVTLTSNGNFDGVLLQGESYRTAFYGGVYRFDDVQENVRVPLLISVSGGRYRPGDWQRWGRQY